MRYPIVILAALALCGCEPDPYVAPVQAPPEGPSQRFHVEIQGRFYAGFENHRRDIVILTDTKTGKQYLAVTGCGVSELWTEVTTSSDGNGNVTTTTETVEE